MSAENIAVDLDKVIERIAPIEILDQLQKIDINISLSDKGLSKKDICDMLDYQKTIQCFASSLFIRSQIAATLFLFLLLNLFALSTSIMQNSSYLLTIVLLLLSSVVLSFFLAKTLKEIILSRIIISHDKSFWLSVRGWKTFDIFDISSSKKTLDNFILHEIRECQSPKEIFKSAYLRIPLMY